MLVSGRTLIVIFMLMLTFPSFVVRLFDPYLPVLLG